MIVITDGGVMTVWDGARLIHEKQMTVHEMAALQVSVATAMRRAVAFPSVPDDRWSQMGHGQDV